MTTPKARYVGDHQGVMVPDFCAPQRKELRKRFERFFGPEEIGRHRAFIKHLGKDDWRVAHPADRIVSELTSAAYPLKVELSNYKTFALKKGALMAEHADFLKTLRTTRRKLRTLSPELDRLLGLDADSLGVADLVDDLAAHVERASALVEMHPNLPRDRVFGHGVAKRLAKEVLEIFGEHDISATERFGDTSLLSATLKYIGDAMGLNLTGATWKNTVTAVRKAKSKVSRADR